MTGGCHAKFFLLGGKVTNHVENLLLEHLCALRDGQVRVEGKLTEMVVRVASLENQVVQLHKNVAFVHEDIAGINLRLDRINEHVERIELRLDLAAAN